MANSKSIGARIKKALGLEATGVRSKTEKDRRQQDMRHTDPMYRITDAWHKKKNRPVDRASLYRTYDDLDNLSPEIGGYLDSAADEATQLNEERNHKVWVTAKKAKVRDHVEDLLYRKLKVDEWTTSTCRTLGKYGDDFGEVLYNKEGVQSIYWGVALTEIMRIETMDGVLHGFIYRKDLASLDGYGAGGEIKLDKLKSELSNPWDYAHFRIMTEKRVKASSPEPNLYGTSMLRRAIRPAYRLDTMLDLLLMYRASRSIDRFILKVDVTGQIPEEQFETLQKWRSWLYELSYANQTTGEFSALGNPLAVGEDIIWPVTKDSASDIESLAGNPNLYEAFDVDLSIEQLAGALSAPKSILGYEDNTVTRDKPFASQDIRFAKTVFKLQSSFMNGLRWIILTDLAINQEALGLSDEDLVDFDLFHLHMVPPSAILHLHRIEAMRDVLDATRDFLDLVSDLSLPPDVAIEWESHVLRHVLGTTDFDIEYFADVLDKQAKLLKKQQKEKEKAAEAGEVEPPVPGTEEETPPEEEPVEGEEEAAAEEPVEAAVTLTQRTLLSEEATQFTRDQLPRGDMEDKTKKDMVVVESVAAEEGKKQSETRLEDDGEGTRKKTD